MALPLKQHAIDSFEMGKKMIPVYLGLLMKFLAYVLGMVTVLLGAVFLDVSSVVRVVFLFTYIALLIAVVIQGMRYNVAKIKALRPPEPYKGKGIREKGQYILRKEGKKK